MKLRSPAILVLTLVLGACDGGSDSTSDGAAGAGGGAGAGGSGGGGGNDGGAGDGGGVSCPATDPAVTVLTGLEATSLQASGDDVVFIDVSGEATDPVRIRKVHKDGTGDLVLHTAAKNHVVTELLVAGSDVLFIDEDYAPAVSEPRVWRVPLAGGMASKVSDTVLDGARFIGADASNAYLEGVTLGKDTFWRMALASGTVTEIATIPGTPLNRQLGGGSLYFAHSVMDMPGVLQFAKLPADGMGAMLTDLGMIKTGVGGCLLGTRPSSVTASNVLCSAGIAGEKLLAWDLAGSMKTEVMDVGLGNRVMPTAPDGDHVYLVQVAGPPIKWSLFEMKTSGFAVSPVACNLGDIQQQLFRKAIPASDAYEVAPGGSDLFWLEKESGGMTAALKRAPK